MGATTPSVATSIEEAPTAIIWRDVRAQPHLEEQEEHADLGEHLEGGHLAQALETVPADQAEVPDEHAGQQLAQHRRLADPAEERAAQARADQDEHHRQQHRHQVHVPAAGRRGHRPARQQQAGQHGEGREEPGGKRA